MHASLTLGGGRLTVPVLVQVENLQLRKTLVDASSEQRLRDQEIERLHHLLGAYQAERSSAGVQTDAIATDNVGVQADAALGFAAPPRPTESRVQRRSRELGITGLAAEMAPEGVGPASVDTRVLGAGLLKPTVRHAAETLCVLYAQPAMCLCWRS